MQWVNIKDVDYNSMLQTTHCLLVPASLDKCPKVDPATTLQGTIYYYIVYRSRAHFYTC